MCVCVCLSNVCVCVSVNGKFGDVAVMFYIIVSLCTSHFPQLTDTLAQTEQKLEDLKLAQARMEANNSARIAAQSAGILLLCTEGFISSVYMHWVRMTEDTCRKRQFTFAALVERLSSVQHERERALATQLRSALEEREKALRMVRPLESKYVRFLARLC